MIISFNKQSLFQLEKEYIVVTERLNIRELKIDKDEEFIFQLLNETSWLKFIGNRNINNLEDAKNYILNGPIASYKEHGFGLFLVELKETNESIGICGLLKRIFFFLIIF